MFKKLISNLPFNPSLIGQVSFYAKRLRREQAVRRAGAVFMVLAMMVQVFAFIAPAQAAVTCSDNDLIRCGVSNKADLLQKFQQNTGGLQSIYSAFHVGQKELEGVVVANPDVVSEPSNNYYSVGRNPSSGDIATFKDPTGSNYFYMRKLHTATNNRVVSFNAFRGTTSAGQTFWILEDCANITIQGPTIDTPSVPTPVVIPPPVSTIPTTPPVIPPTSPYPLTIDYSACDAIKGWSYNPDNSSSTTQIHFYFYNASHTGSPIFGDKTFTTVARPDINTAFGIAGSHGYEYSVPAALQNGNQYSVDVIAVNDAGVALTYRTVNIGPCGTAPVPTPKVTVTTPQTPKLEIIKDNVTKGTVKRGSQITYRIQYRNTGPAVAQNVRVTDTLPDQTSFVGTTVTTGFSSNGQQLTWNLGIVGVSSTYSPIDVTVKVADAATANASLCNLAHILADGGYDVASNQVCNPVEVIEDCPSKPNVGIPKSDKTRCQICAYIPGVNFDDAKCIKPDTSTAACTYLRIVNSATPNVVSFVREFEASASVSGTAKITAYWYDFDGNGTYDVKHDATLSTTNTDRATWEYKTAGTYMAKLLVKTTLGDKSSDACIQVVKLEDTPKPIILNLNKKARNITQGLEDATTKEAHAGDVIEYSMITTNAGGTTSKNTVLDVENLSDVKLYADIIDKGDGEYIDSSQTTLRWASIDIAAGQSIVKTVRIKVKDPVPTTPVGTSDPNGYDLLMTNRYGTTTVTIPLPKSIVKKVEGVATTLPNTGPGTSLILGFFVTVIVGYFFARSRLLAEELEIIKHEYTVGA